MRMTRNPLDSKPDHLQALQESCSRLGLVETDVDVLENWVQMLNAPMRKMHQIASKGQLQDKLAQLSMVNMDLQAQIIKLKKELGK